MFVGYVSRPSSRTRPKTSCWVGPTHCPPSSTTSSGRSPTEWFSVRPPTRSRASRTWTSAPARVSSRAAARPESPAPTTTTSQSCRPIGSSATPLCFDSSLLAESGTSIPPRQLHGSVDQRDDRAADAHAVAIHTGLEQTGSAHLDSLVHGDLL